jgi:ribosomal protein S18 acetylase RimI-like enzyme
MVEFLKQEGTYKPVWAAEENLVSILKQDQDLIQIAEQDGQLVGMIVLTPQGKNQTFFYRFIVKKDLRGGGIGSRLIQVAEETVKKKDGKKIALYVELRDQKVQEFYKKRGYVDDGNGPYLSFYKEL